MWFGKNELRLYLNRAKIYLIGGRGPRGPPLNTPMNARQKFCSICVVNEWNRLPPDVIRSTTVDTFKNWLDKLWTDMANIKPIGY